MVTRRMPGLFVTACAAFLLLSSLAHGQLTSTILESGDPLTIDEMRLLDGFAGRMVENLGGEDARRVRDARRDLLSPLVTRQTSRNFRVAYDEVLTPKLRALLDDPETPATRRATVLNVLGSIASEGALNSMEKELTAKPDSVRYAAAMSYARALQAISGNRDAFANSADAQVSMARRLQTAIEAETQSFVLHALLEAADTFPEPSLAVETLCRGLQAQLRNGYQNGPNERIPRLAEGLLAARNQLINMLGENDRREELLVAETSVMALRVAVEHGATDSIPEPLQGGYGELATIAEQALLILCNESNTTVSAEVRRGDYQAALRDLERVWLGPTGPVYGNTDWDLTPQRIDQLLGP